MSSGIHIVERIEYEIEVGEPFQVELSVFNVCMMGDEFDVGIELLSNIFCDNGFWFFDMFLSEEELAIEIGKINSVKINYVDLPKASEDEVLEQLAAYTACADE